MKKSPLEAHIACNFAPHLAVFICLHKHTSAPTTKRTRRLEHNLLIATIAPNACHLCLEDEPNKLPSAESVSVSCRISTHDGVGSYSSLNCLCFVRSFCRARDGIGDERHSRYDLQSAECVERFCCIDALSVSDHLSAKESTTK